VNAWLFIALILYDITPEENVMNLSNITQHVHDYFNAYGHVIAPNYYL